MAADALGLLLHMNLAAAVAIPAALWDQLIYIG
jgi:hypothetical protein